jgi:D-arabinose 1-dehydrogenase-like Zn-dependent alcohol dehydrogenase
MKHWKVGPGKKVGIVGLGGLGHMGVKFARAFGAHVVLFTTSPGKAADALRLGDHEVVVLRMSEAVQNDPDLLALIRDAGAKPGSLVRAAAMGRNLVLGSCDHEVTLPGYVAEHLFIAAE